MDISKIKKLQTADSLARTAEYRIARKKREKEEEFYNTLFDVLYNSAENENFFTYIDKCVFGEYESEALQLLTDKGFKYELIEFQTDAGLPKLSYIISWFPNEEKQEEKQEEQERAVDTKEGVTDADSHSI